MNNADQVADLIEKLKTGGIPLAEAAWKTALACVGWPYVFGARGELCTPSNRRSRYSDAHPTIKTKCQNFDGKGTCKGCKWYPDKKRVRCYDCRGFTYWVLLQIYDWKLVGAGATSQWNTESNWSKKGKIADMPKDTLCCLFVNKGNKMEHTGFVLNNETVECSSGVQHFTTRNKKWTHWAVPVCVSGDVPPKPEPTPEKGYAIVTGTKVALRQDASTKATIITRIDKGKTVKLEPEPDEWDYVSYGGKKGWMMKKFLKEGDA